VSNALVIFKPDAAYRLAARAGIWGWLCSERSWKLESMTWFQPTASLITDHYDFLQGRPFFPWLVDFMTAMPVLVGRVTAGEETLKQMRSDLGETRIAQSRPGSLRDALGTFADAGLNLRTLASRPSLDAPFTYRFYVEIENANAAALESTLSRIDGSARVLGLY